MIKLSKSQRELLKSFFNDEGCSLDELIDSIEAEVLRLNGITDDPRKTVFVRARAANNKWLSWEIVEPTDPNAVRAALICYEATGTPIGDLVDVLDEKPSERVYKSADELFDALGIDTKPRATGCPETMDETAEIAVASKQAGEEKSPPATGPAG